MPTYENATANGQGEFVLQIPVQWLTSTMPTAIHTTTLTAAISSMMPTARPGSILISGTCWWKLDAFFDILCLSDTGSCNGAGSP